MCGEVGIDRFQVVRGYPCWERSLTDRLEYGKPSQYETGLITVDYPGILALPPLILFQQIVGTPASVSRCSQNSFVYKVSNITQCCCL